jgi:uncharacterized protein (DUF2237 family)
LDSRCQNTLKHIHVALVLRHPWLRTVLEAAIQTLPLILEIDVMATIVEPVNVLGEKLEICGTDPETGFYRDGCCNTGPDDLGAHVVCAVVTDDFLEYSSAQGNDLSTPRPEFGFPGLKEGDSWCLCASRWQEAFEADSAPRVKLRATHRSALKYSTLEDLKRHSVDLS